MLRWPVDPMRATGAAELPATRRGSTPVAYEPKFDGFRALAWVSAGGVRLQSRNATDLSYAFPDVCRALTDHLPAGVILDGELLVWDVDRDRTSFTLLQRRLTAGRRIAEEAARHPAHFVAFDVLRDAGGRELLQQPLTVRRRELERLLAGAGPQLPLCPQTADRKVAESWFADLSVAGVEGLVVKKTTDRYLPGRPRWVKVRIRHTAEYVVGGVTGSLARPTSLLVGRYDQRGVLRHLGQTLALNADQRREVAAGLRGMVFQGDAAGHPWPCPLPAGWSGDFNEHQPLAYVPVEPTLVAEVLADTAADGPFGRLRHRCRAAEYGWTYARRTSAPSRRDVLPN